MRRQRSPRAGEIYTWLSRRNFKARPEEGSTSGPQLRVSPCPACGHKRHTGSAVISTVTGLWKCFRCNAKGNWLSFTRAVGEPIPDAYEDAQPVDFSSYERIRQRLRRPLSGGHHPELLSWLRRRGIIDGTMDDWRVSSAGPELVRFPLMAQDGEGHWQMANAKIRRALGRGDGPKTWFEVKGGPTGLAVGNHLLGRKPRSWGEATPEWASAWLDLSETPTGEVWPVKRVLVTEGEIDAMTGWQLGIPNCLSLPNGASAVDCSGLLRYVPDGSEVWLAVDMDEAGDRAAELFFAQLGTERVRRLNLPAKDLNDWLQAKPELKAEDVLSLPEAGEKEASRGWIDVTLSGGDELPSEVVCETPWPRLTRRLDGGFRSGQTTGLLAPSGMGKTTLSRNVLVHCLKRRVKVGLIELEGSKGDVKRELRSQAEGWIRPDMEEFLAEHLKLLMLSHLSGKGVTWQQTIEDARQMMREGARLVVIDNWDYITPPDRHGATLKAMAYGKFQELCKEYGAHGFVVWQPYKVDRGEIVNSGQQKGMSTALQDADVYMTLNKIGNARRLEVEKARVVETADMSSVIMLRYNEKTRCLDESDSQADLRPQLREGDNPEWF